MFRALGSVGGSGCEAADRDTCLSNAATALAGYGGSAQAMKIEMGFNALRKSGDVWCTCRDTDSAELQCEAEALSQYLQLGGNPAEWQAFDRQIAWLTCR